MHEQLHHPAGTSACLADDPVKHFATDLLTAMALVDTNVLDERAARALMAKARNEGDLQAGQNIAVRSFGHDQKIPIVRHDGIEGREIGLHQRFGQAFPVLAEVVIRQQASDRTDILVPYWAYEEGRRATLSLIRCKSRGSACISCLTRRGRRRCARPCPSLRGRWDP
jgi:hypothetical protein